jgi:hypothetical protein
MLKILVVFQLLNLLIDVVKDRKVTAEEVDRVAKFIKQNFTK